MRLLVYPDPEESAHTLFAILHPRRPLWFLTNRTGLEICRILVQGEAPEAAEEFLCRKYGLARDAARRDIDKIAPSLAQFLTPATKPRSRIPRLRRLFIHITNQCNLGCRHCYAQSSIDSEEHLAPDLILDLMRQLQEHQGESITITGGEPLRHPSIEAIVAEACARFERVSLLTNATLVTEELARRLRHDNLRLQISLDSADPHLHDAIRGKGAFEKAMAGISVWARIAGPEKITLCAVATSGNLHALPQLVKLAGDLKVARVRILPVRPVGRAGKLDLQLDVDAYLSTVEIIKRERQSAASKIDVTYGIGGLLLTVPGRCSDESWCPLGEELTIDAKGDAYPCALLLGPEFKLGNVRDSSLSALLEGAVMKACCEALVGRRSIPECAACRWQNFCQAGCMGQAWQDNATIWSRDLFCDYRLRAYPKAFDKILAGSKGERGARGTDLQNT